MILPLVLNVIDRCFSATDLNLGEEEMVKLASLGHGCNHDNAIDVMKRSLALRNK